MTLLLVLLMEGTPYGLGFHNVLSRVEVAAISELEVVTIQNLNMEVKIVLKLVQQLRQRCVTASYAPSEGAILIGLNFQIVLFHVEVEVCGIGPEIVLTLNLSIVVKTVQSLDLQLRQKSVATSLVLYQEGIPLGLSFQIVLSYVEEDRAIGQEIVLTLNLNMVVKIVQVLDLQWRQKSVTVNHVLFMGVTPLGLTSQNVLYHVEVGARGIELEIAQTHSLNSAGRIAQKLDHRLIFKFAILSLVLYTVTILHGQRSAPVVLRVEMVIDLAIEHVQILCQNMVVEIARGWGQIVKLRLVIYRHVRFTAVLVNGQIFQPVLRRVVILRKPGLGHVITPRRVTEVGIARHWDQIRTQFPARLRRVQSTEITQIGQNSHLALKRVGIARNYDGDIARILSLVLEGKIVPV